jgi:putative acyl-CoA dehydrogenase
MERPMEHAPATHTVFNQTPPLTDYNLYATDAALQEAVRRESGVNRAAAGAVASGNADSGNATSGNAASGNADSGNATSGNAASGAAASGAVDVGGKVAGPAVAEWAAEFTTVGAELGTSSTFDQGRLANRNPPVLQGFNVVGERIDRIEFHPSWHVLMQGIIGRGYHCSPWTSLGHGGAAQSHAARAAGYMMQAQVECGTLCPTTMTYGAMAVMRRDPVLARDWLPHVLTRAYDPRDVSIEHKRGGLIGMGMTEKQGGSDVRANTTRATRSADGSYRITGHKWFFSAPQCDAHLVLAQTARGLSCFLLPRRLADGALNGIRIQRLKDKLGNRSNASSEVEFADAWAHLVGEEGRGIPTILEMGTYTRLDCVLGSSGMMRQAVVQTLHHARHRKAFGQRLIDQPLMRGVLADLVLESEAATALSLRLARAFDEESPQENALRRVLTSAAKFWVCKRGCELAAEAMEVLGGNGYTEELPLARIAREMPVNSIWEGSGNIMCLDVLRALAKAPLARDVVIEELAAARKLDRHFDAAFEAFAAMLAASAIPQAHARHVSHKLVTLVQAGILLRGAANPGAQAVAEGFCSTRLSADSGWGAVFGASPVALDTHAILERAWPG